MNYLEFNIETKTEDETDIITALLGELGFESFMNENNFLKAYIAETESINLVTIVEELTILLNDYGFTQTFEVKVIEKQNWNETWEKNFEPIFIDDKCVVRAPFHNLIPNVLNIVIEPKMSFGTGHHQTTFLMLQNLFNFDLNNKSILDMGCGTALLAIAAEKLNAKNIIAIDIEDWAYENALENATLNNCTKINVLLGDANQIGESKFEIILANINKNILMNDLKTYADALTLDGKIFLSGFFTTDAQSLIEKGNTVNLKHTLTKNKEEWCMLGFDRV